VTRLQRNLLLLLINAFLLAASAAWLPYENSAERISVGSAWVCMLFLCGALLIGPSRRAAGQSAPANIYVRREFGVWAAIQGFVHFYYGSVVSMNQTYIQAFVRSDTPPLAASVRDALFNWGGMAGFIASLIFLLLLLLSSDRALRWVGADRWKKLQKSARVAFWLTVLHGFAFQALEGRYLPMALLVLVMLLVFWRRLGGRERKA